VETLAETADGVMTSLSYLRREEEQLTQVWTVRDRADCERSIQKIANQFAAIRHRLEELRAQIDTLWERFTMLTLERILSGQLREFLDELDTELYEVNPQLIEMECAIDRLRIGVQEQRRTLGKKIILLETLAHRTSSLNHLNMMLGRLEGLEAHLLGRSEALPEGSERHQHRQTSLPGDLLYLRVRLLTTRLALIASNQARQLSAFDAELMVLLPDVEHLKVDISALTTRLECINGLSRYWLAYLDLTEGGSRFQAPTPR
jgi:regulator of replication initiation timing